ncbi:hypothetical protein CBR_g94 [Chara braunii]|uniref:Uncharacterized protein n=1 Tax=Chara braunii TaxID=69332 RepID=A0A388JLR8_CHABU|nr:hypothetical protein CBR_g94 [Chara braunii]|eukprot:GBG58693.1 hypothetical protein CBR_g94 [Chara braunii]
MSSSVSRMLVKVMSGIPKGHQLSGAGLRRFTGVVSVSDAEAAVPSSTAGIRDGDVVDYGVESFDSAPDDESRSHSHSLSGDDLVGDVSQSSSDPSAGEGIRGGASNRNRRPQPPPKKGKGGVSYVWEKGEILGSAF